MTTTTTAPTTVRKCNECPKVYDVRRRGQGGSLARPGDLENFPWDGRTGVKAENAHWFQGAFCSDECYAFAYYEPPSNY